MDLIGWLQIFPLISTIGILVFEGLFDKNTDEDSRKRTVRWVSSLAIVFSLAAIMIGRKQSYDEQVRREAVFNQALENQKKQLLEASGKIQSSQQHQIAQAEELKETQKQVIQGQQKQLDQSTELRSMQGRGIEEMTRLGLDRYMSGLEISYKPSSNQWSNIAKSYRTLKPSPRESSYYDAPIIAERMTDGWSVIFGWTKIIEGNKDMGWKMFPPVFVSDKDEKGFATLIKEACIPLLIKWSDGSVTDIEPWTKKYPTVITISREGIAFILRPPILNLYLWALRQDRNITVRTRGDYPPEIKFKSLDGNVKWDQTVTLQWKKDDSNDPSDRVKPFYEKVQLRPVFRLISNR
jgi:hypothetical protein